MRRNAVPDLRFGTYAMPHIHRDELPLIERLLRNAQLAQRTTRAAGRPGTPTICAILSMSKLHERFGAQAVFETAPPTVVLASDEVRMLKSAVEDLDFLPGSESLIADCRLLLEDLHTRWGHARAQRDHVAIVG